jgi:hypothetical protein
MTPESQNNSLLGNDSVNTFPRKRTRATIEHPVSKQRIGKHITIGALLETMFSVGADPGPYNEDLIQLTNCRFLGLNKLRHKLLHYPALTDVPVCSRT